MNILKIAILGLGLPLAVMATGCASVTKGNDQTMAINTIGCKNESERDVQCTVVNKDNNLRVDSPTVIEIEKGRQPLVVTCKSDNGKAEGMVVVESGYEAMNAGNIILGGVIGLGVDAATGAMWKFPSSVTVPLECKGGK